MLLCVTVVHICSGWVFKAKKKKSSIFPSVKKQSSYRKRTLPHIRNFVLWNRNIAELFRWIDRIYCNSSAVGISIENMIALDKYNEIIHFITNYI